MIDVDHIAECWEETLFLNWRFVRYVFHREIEIVGAILRDDQLKQRAACRLVAVVGVCGGADTQPKKTGPSDSSAGFGHLTNRTFSLLIIDAPATVLRSGVADCSRGVTLK
jgi:hypothetical protein